MYGLETVMDQSLTHVEQLVFEANSHHEAIRMAADDFLWLECPLIGSFARTR